jgi:hypothetical protein
MEAVTTTFPATFKPKQLKWQDGISKQQYQPLHRA